MTISRVNAATWGLGSKLTSSQANGLDLNGTYALDKRSGQTDTLESIVSCSGDGRIVPTHATGANADTTYYATGGNTVLRIPSSLTADRAYTFNSTGAAAGDAIHIYSDAALGRIVTIKGHSGNTLCKLGSSPYLDDSMDARGCVLRHNGSNWYVESLSYERYEIPTQLALQAVGHLARAAAGAPTPGYAASCYDSKHRRFYYGGGTDIVGYTESAGAIVSDDVIGGGVKATLTVNDIAASDTGIVCAVCISTYVYTQPDGGSFGKYSAFAANTNSTAVTYDVANTKFVAATQQSTPGGKLYYSAYGQTWAGATTPPNAPANYGGGVMIGSDGAGRVVAAYYDNTLGKLHFNYSDDAGTNWSSGSTVTGLATGLDQTQIARKLEYNEIKGEWAVAMGISGSATYVITSSDGVMWSLTFTSGSASDPGVFALIATGGLWIGLGRSHDVVISRDSFTSMQNVGTKIGVATGSYDRPSLAKGGSLLFCLSNDKIFTTSVPGRNLTNVF